MKPGLSLFGMLLALVLHASTPLAEEKSQVTGKKAAAAKIAAKDAAAQLKHAPRTTQQVLKPGKRHPNAFVQPDQKSLGLGCASGED